ncbi:nonribosomal peptide synthetase [Xylaria palmicola]|nr:nonribosomal peptide synthetase [Xylaria palmicola]
MHVYGHQSFGRRLIPHVIDEVARDEPERECFSFPRSSNPHDGRRVITFGEYANAINHIVHAIIEKCGSPAAGSIPAIAYIGPNDGRYMIFLVAALKAGYKAFFLSPANSPSGQLSLLEQTDCWNIWFPSTYKAMVQPWIHSRHMNIVEAEPIEAWFPSHTVPEIPYRRTFEEAQWLPFVVLHTSGSTGNPKAIVVNQGMLSVGDAYHNLDDWNGFPLFYKLLSVGCQRFFLPIPLFHAAGVYMFMIRTIYWSAPVVLGVPGIPLTADLAVECLNTLDFDGAVFPPVVLEDLSCNEDHMQLLARLNMVVFGGSSLAAAAGYKLAKRGVKLVNAISSTECTPYPTYVHHNPDIWQYFLFNSELLGAEWRKVDDDSDVHHLVVVRKEEHPQYQSVFYNFPDDPEFLTRDLYKPHPSLKDYWMYCGRADDIVVLSSGKKFNPVATETQVGQHHLLKGALVFGSNKLQPGLLIEPREPRQEDTEDVDLVSAVWPTVEIANREAANHAKIEKGLILVASAEKPLPRAAKGNILRPSALKLYEDEINHLYKNMDEVHAVVPRIAINSAKALENSVVDLFKGTTKDKISTPDTDFFSVGIDSIDIIRMSQQLRAGFQALGISIDSTMIRPQNLYRFSTVNKLCQYLYPLLGSCVNGDCTTPQKDDRQTMRKLWEKYAFDMQQLRPSAADEGQTIILTGSTGMLGSYLLDSLLACPTVGRVVCLNRRDDGGKEAQMDAAIERGLSRDFEGRIEFLHADLSSQRFGLPSSTYNCLLLSADRIIHTAWPVNFNMSVESFEPHIQGICNIAKFASRARKAVPVIFISTTAVADGWSTSLGSVPEIKLEDFSLPKTGYGQSKMVGSLVLENISRANHFPAATIRIGQIAGPETDKGSWNRHEWLPILVASSLYLGALPSDLGPLGVDWITVESACQVILEIAGISQRVEPAEMGGYYNCVNPTTSSWESLIPGILDVYGIEKLPKLVPFDQWIAMLENSEAATYDDSRLLTLNPGAKLLDTYRRMLAQDPVVFDTSRALERSPALRSARVITPDMMRNWCRQWHLA